MQETLVCISQQDREDKSNKSEEIQPPSESLSSRNPKSKLNFLQPVNGINERIAKTFSRSPLIKKDNRNGFGAHDAINDELCNNVYGILPSSLSSSSLISSDTYNDPYDFYESKYKETFEKNSEVQEILDKMYDILSLQNISEKHESSRKNIKTDAKCTDPHPYTVNGLQFAKHVPSQDEFHFLQNTGCGCVNPGTSHACSSRLIRGDSFGILNPMFAETDPIPPNKISPSNSCSKTIEQQTSFNSKTKKNSKSEYQRQSRDSLSSSSSSSKRNSYTDFMTALSPMELGPSSSFFYPNDLKEELLFPLPLNLEKNVVKNNNAKEASFYISKPKRKTKRKPLKLHIAPCKEDDVIKDDENNGFEFSSNIGVEDRKELETIQTSLSENCKLSPTSTPSSINSDGESVKSNFGDNYNRHEYLAYKSFSEESRKNSCSSNTNECIEDTNNYIQLRNEPSSKRRSSCFVSSGRVPSYNNQTSKYKRKTSLPCGTVNEQCDISSIFDHDLQKSLQYIYQPLPIDIFQKSNGSYDKSSSRYKELYQLNSINNLTFQKHSDDVSVAIDTKNSQESRNTQPYQMEPLKQYEETLPNSSLIKSGNPSCSTVQSPTLKQSQFLRSESLSSPVSFDPIPCATSNVSKDEDPIQNKLAQRDSTTDREFLLQCEGEVQEVAACDKMENIQTGARRKTVESHQLDEDQVTKETESSPKYDYSILSSSSSSTSSRQSSPSNDPKKHILVDSRSSSSLSSSCSSLNSSSSCLSLSSSSSSTSSSSSSSSSTTDSSDIEDLIL